MAQNPRGKTTVRTKPLNAKTRGKPGKVRRAEEFTSVPTAAAEAPRRENPVTSWSLAMIREARDDQMRGHFKRAVRLAEMLRTDDALFVARSNRIAPQSAIALELEPHESARGRALARKAALGVKIARDTLVSLHGTLADHGVAIGFNKRTTNKSGTRVDFEHIAWPLEHVRYNETKECLETPVRNGNSAVPIVHGDGWWTVYRKAQVKPWTEDAAVLPASLVWASHTEALTDWNATTRSHGLAKMIGELPTGIALQKKNPDGSFALTPEALGLLQMLQSLVTGESAVGVAPPGAKITFPANASNADKIFETLVMNREKAAARIYLGTDAILGSVGGAPGVDIAALFSIASGKLQGDFEALEQGFYTGVYAPWAAINAGDSSYAPWLVYQVPDPDAARRAEEEQKKIVGFCEAVRLLREAGFVVDQLVADDLARRFGIRPAPILAAQPTAPAAPAPLQAASAALPLR